MSAGDYWRLSWHPSKKCVFLGLIKEAAVFCSALGERGAVFGSLWVTNSVHFGGSMVFRGSVETLRIILHCIHWVKFPVFDQCMPLLRDI